MQHCFSYGCNMSSRQMALRCPSAVVMSVAWLPDYRLTFPRRCSEWAGGVAGLVADEDGRVEGVVWEMREPDLAALDAYEGIAEREYIRERVQVHLADGKDLAVWAYFAVPEEGGPFFPGSAYLNTMIAGAIEHGLSATWLHRLREVRSQ